MKRYSFLFFLISGILCFNSPAIARQQDLRFERITTANGLSNDVVNAIVQDHQGFIWIGGDDGLNRYDGYTVKVFRHDPFDSTSLSKGRVETLFVDYEGTLWISTWAGGLSRFDAETETFTYYPHNPVNTKGSGGSEVDRKVNVIMEDRQGRLWVGTGTGALSRFDPDGETVTYFFDDPAHPDNPAHNSIRTLYADTRGHLWIGTGEPFTSVTGGGLLRFDPETGNYHRYKHDPDDEQSLLDDRIGAIMEDRAGTLYVGTSRNGLHRYDREQDVFIRLLPDASNPDRLHAPQGDEGTLGASPLVHILHEDQAGMVWIGTIGGGLHRFDPATKTLTRYGIDPQDPASLSSNQLWSFLEDRQGTLWFGTFNSGANKVNPYPDRFRTYVHDERDPNSLSSSNIGGLYEDQSGTLWIGTLGGGLNRLDGETGEVTRYRNDPSDTTSLSNDYVQVIYEDRLQELWIGTADGLDRLDRQTGRFTQYDQGPANPIGMVNGFVQSIYEDRTGTLWVGTLGLHRFDREKERFTYFRLPGGIRVNAILGDIAGGLWVGTWGSGGGLYRFDPEKGSFTPHIESISIQWLYKDGDGLLWIGTQSEGLVRYDPVGGDRRRFTIRDGLPSMSIMGVLEDDRGHLWISTGNGLAEMNPRTHAVIAYDVSDGLPGNTFNWVSAFKSRRGELFFGSTRGLVSVHPGGQTASNPHPPDVVLTDLQLFNAPVLFGPQSPLSKPLSMTDSLVLGHDQNDLTIAYVGLHYSNPSQNQYRFLLEGFDVGWVDVGGRRSARYTNLSPDTYVFRVEAASSDGVWTEEGASLVITILPPWWRAWWAYLLYGLIFLAGVFTVDRIQRRRIVRRERERAREREREQAREIEKAHTELQRSHQHLKTTQAQLIQAEKMASLGQLTAGIAHEIKNPLNFVNNFAQLSTELTADIAEELDAHADKTVAEIRDDLDEMLADLKLNTEKIEEHGRRADGIVQAMMDHARGGEGQRRAVGVNALVEEYVNLAFHGMRANVPDFNVTIERDYDEAVGEVEMAPQDMGRVLINLLNNAFDAVHERALSQNGQFAPTVSVSTRQVEGQVEIRVADNGSGIAEEVREKIFEPFFTTKPAGSGTGLGLSLSYDIVTQGHGGTMTVESEEGEGAVFLVTLPVTLRDDR